MKSWNKSVILIFFLLITIIYVNCPTTEEDIDHELLEEFKNVEPLDDLLHGFLNIKYDTVYWNEITDINEKIFRGNDVLKVSARTYYYDLYNTALEMGIPEFLTPEEFCSTQYKNEEDDCISAIEAIGCGANNHGADCFEVMYFHWKKTNLVGTSIQGTKFLSDAQLLAAIHKGSPRFRDLSDEELFDAFSEDYEIIYNLSDHNLLRDFYKSNYDAHSDGEYRNDSDPDFYGRNAYMEYLRLQYNEPDDDSLNRSMFDEVNLADARERSYGIPHLTYQAICGEYQRRKNAPKSFDNFYAEDICDKFRHSTWDTNNFKTHADFCEKYLSGEL